MRQRHRWDLSTEEARALQVRLAKSVLRQDRFNKITYVAGADVGFEQGGRITRAALVVFRYPSLEPVSSALHKEPTRFPYVPGYLSFREIPALMAALEQLTPEPDLILCDGQGLAHPRRFGVACHLGVLTDIPTIGVAKSRLIGSYRDPGIKKGARQPLKANDETIGVVLRTRNKVKPVFVSIGHRVGLNSAIDLVLACTTRYRLPEPIRAADKLASRR